jgi:aspartate/methionine/tyrosine aminotransferase
LKRLFPDRIEGLVQSEIRRMSLGRAGVDGIPGSSFYPDPEDDRQQIRICYAKNMTDLQEACRRIRSMKPVLA